jgi:hypothetical protein
VPDFPFKWSAEFVASDMRVRIVVESDTRNRPEQRYVSFTGEIDGHSGQCDATIREAVEGIEEAAPIREILDAWNEIHLKPIVGLDALQLATLDEVQVNLILINGERYGSAASFEDIDDAEFSNASDDHRLARRDQANRKLAGAFEAAGLDPDKLDPPSPDYDDQGLEEDDPAHDRAENCATSQAIWSRSRGLRRLESRRNPDPRVLLPRLRPRMADDIGAIDAESEVAAQSHRLGRRRRSELKRIIPRSISTASPTCSAARPQAPGGPPSQGLGRRAGESWHRGPSEFSRRGPGES